MCLGTNSIRTWAQMKEAFLENYRDYCMPQNIKDEVFKMTQKEDENLEDLVEIFVYNVKREKMYNLDEETLKALLLRAIKDKWINLLNLTSITNTGVYFFFFMVLDECQVISCFSG